MQQGYGNSEASRIVGINRRTGKRWRNGWHSPPPSASCRPTCDGH
ncbi:helix-turn-helix domain-containing protein [Streptomyces sp. NPDC079020]